jgi:cytochrome c peroxidase
MKTNLLPLCLLLLLGQACETDERTLQDVSLDLPETPYSYDFATDNDVPTLGRVLFYDKQLSRNNSVSCSSCHKQTLGFADNARFSLGFENQRTARNSMPIQNLQANDSSSFPQFLFWDGRETILPVMVLKPIVNHVEMGIDDLDALADKLEQSPYYHELFIKAYGDAEITQQRIATALTSFLVSINTRDTKFDRAMQTGEGLSPLENEGKMLFEEKYDCNSCHQVEDPHGYLSAGTFANIGLDQVYADNGLGEITRQANDNGKFRIPSLRNVALTAPYMHDGRFETLDDVIEHYSENIQNNSNLDFRLRTNGGPAQFHISEHESKALVAFLNTLTDYKTISDPKFSDPFKLK